MIKNFEKWRAAPQVLRAPEGVEGGFEAPAIHVEVKEFEEYLRKALHILTTTEIPPHDVKGREDIQKLPHNHLGTRVLEAAYVQRSTKDNRPAPGWEKQKSDQRRVQPNGSTMEEILYRLHRLVSTAISVKKGEIDQEEASPSARTLSSTLHDEKATRLKIINGLLPAICSFVTLDEVDKKRRDAVDYDREYKEASLRDDGTESHKEGFDVRISNARKIMALLIEKELSLVSENSVRSSVLQAVLGSTNLWAHQNSLMQKEAAKVHGVEEDAIRKIKREFFLWSLLMASNKEGDLISKRQHGAYIRSLRERPVGDRNKLYPAFDTVLKIEEILFSGPDISLLCQDLTQRSGLFLDEIFKKFWLDLRMPYTAAFLAAPSVNIDDEETKKMLSAFLSKKAAAVKLL